MMNEHWLAGVDGCPAGWVSALVRPAGEEVRVRVVPRFADVKNAPGAPGIIAVDVPIGLPQRIGVGGRGPEAAVRKLLGARQSSVFSVPARAAIYAQTFSEACRIGMETSQPPRKISKQLFMIAPKIREVDILLREDPALKDRVFEVHPEVAFWRLNGNRALDEPKKIKGVPYAPGLALGRAAQGCARRRCSRRARLRGDRAPHPRRRSRVVPGFAHTRRIRIADCDLGVTARRSGAPRSGEPGIHEHGPRCVSTGWPWPWVPDLALRASPE